MSKKLEKIQLLLKKGVYDPKILAQKLGYKGNSLTKGISEVNGILETLK